MAKELQARVLNPDQFTPSAPPTTQSAGSQQPLAPICGIHSTPMVQVQGKHGPFWSCHEKNVDGSWCSYKPDRSRSTPPTHSFPTA
jgi:hypothetical protein